MKMYKWNGRRTTWSDDDKVIKGAIYEADEDGVDDEQIYIYGIEKIGYWHDVNDFTEIDLIEDDDEERRLG